MGYSLVKKFFGTSKRSCLFTIDTDLEISDFMYAKELGYFFVCKKNHCIGLGDEKGNIDFGWIGSPNQRGFVNGIKGANLLDFPDSICLSSHHNSIYLFESGGSRIRRIEVSVTNPAIMSVFGERDNNNFARCFSNVEDKSGCESSCVASDSSVFFCFAVLNRLISVRESMFRKLIGNGKSGFSVSNNHNECMLNCPNSIAMGNGSIYVSDSKNFCIRRFGSGEVVAGHPLRSGDQDGKGTECLLNRPSHLRISGGMGYIVDGNKIKYLALSDFNVGTIFEADNIVSIGTDGRDLLILEKA